MELTIIKHDFSQMNNSYQHFKYIVSQDFIVKTNPFELKHIPGFFKIQVQNSPNFIVIDENRSAPLLSSLLLLCGRGSKRLRGKKPVSHIKMKKKSLLDSQFILHKTFLYNFIFHFVNSGLGKTRNLTAFNIAKKNIISNGVVTLRLKELSVFIELEEVSHLFNLIKEIDLNFTIKEKAKSGSSAIKETTPLFILLLSGFQLPIKSSRFHKASNIIYND